MTKMRIDPQRPGIIRWDDDPLTGILAGIRAAEIVEAVSAHDGLKAEIERLRADLAAALEDRARFPAKPDGIGRMIGAHIGNLKHGRDEANRLACDSMTKSSIKIEQICAAARTFLNEQTAENAAQLRTAIGDDQTPGQEKALFLRTTSAISAGI